MSQEAQATGTRSNQAAEDGLYLSYLQELQWLLLQRQHYRVNHLVELRQIVPTPGGVYML